MNVIINKAMINILDSSSVLPVISSGAIELTDELKDYITLHIEKLYNSDDSKDCTFCDYSWVPSFLKDESSDNLSLISSEITSKIFNVMLRNKDIPIGDVVIGNAVIDNRQAVFMLKFEYKNAFVHYIDNSDKKGLINIINYKTILPSFGGKATEGFIVFYDTLSIRLLEKKYMVDGLKEVYLSNQILQCDSQRSPKETFSKILRAAKKVTKGTSMPEDVDAISLDTAVYRTLKEKSVMDTEMLADVLYENDISAKNEFFNLLSEENITVSKPVQVSEKVTKKYEKKSIKTISGVEIKIPSNLYSNKDEIEFINNADGTVSLLIKHVEV
ncbi:nucleoid-associated protein [Anaerotignum sp.]|uniref:nucleoid-associated protein n=1 Tax=Anaerotignum sp. TaxID=2039241 RepID=UPI00289A6DE7|nr:nucleoid-associated protein [Anaerotignum sp.]